MKYPPFQVTSNTILKEKKRDKNIQSPVFYLIKYGIKFIAYRLSFRNDGIFFLPNKNDYFKKRQGAKNQVNSDEYLIRHNQSTGYQVIPSGRRRHRTIRATRLDVSFCCSKSSGGRVE